MQGLIAVHHDIRVEALEHFRAGIEQRPRIAGPEVIVFRCPPFLQHGRDLAGHEGSAIRRLDHQIMGLGIVDAPTQISGDAVVDPVEPVSQSTHRPGGQVTQVIFPGASISSARTPAGP